MPRVTGPNGLEIPVSDDMAAALLRHRDGEYQLTDTDGATGESKPAPAKKTAAKKTAAAKSTDTDSATGSTPPAA